MEIAAHVVEETNGSFVSRRLELGPPRDNEVLVRIVATGMCHTDLAIAAQYSPFPLPAVLGHEGAGVVEAVGPSVSHVEPGDHVVLTFASCGRCMNCAAHHEAYCLSFRERNFAGRRDDGSTPFESDTVSGFFFGQSSFAEYALADASSVVKVRKDAPLEMLGPLGCGIQTGAGAMLNVLKPLPDAIVVVTGVGAVGVAAIMGARILGCRTVIAVDRVAGRLELAGRCGATRTVDTSREDLGAVLDTLGGVDVAFDTSGSPDLARLLVPRLRFNGSFAHVGGGPRDATLEIPLPFLVPGRKIMGITEGDAHPPEFIPKLVDLLMDGKLPLQEVVRFYSPADINQAVADSKSGATIKPIIRYGVSDE